MFKDFNLTKEELKLFEFLVKLNSDKPFTTHDISCAGCVVDSKVYSSLYNKGLLNRYGRGKYGLNIELLQEKTDELKAAEEKHIQDQKARKKKRFRIIMIITGVCSLFAFLANFYFGLVWMAIWGLVLFLRKKREKKF